MAQYGYPPVGPPKPPVSGGDIAVSVTALILTVVLGAVASFFGLFSLAFIANQAEDSVVLVDMSILPLFTAVLPNLTTVHTVVTVGEGGYGTAGGVG